jgi:Uma2 family endonuclease
LLWTPDFFIHVAYICTRAAVRKYEEHYTISDWAEWKDRWELIEGLPYCMSPMPSFRHQDVNGKMYASILEEIRRKRCKSCRVMLPIDWQVSEDTIVQPDLLIICQPVKGLRLFEAPSAIFEILSPSTRQKDKTVKFELYQSQGVQQYTMVDPDTESLESYTLNAGGQYELSGTGPVLSLKAGDCELSIDFVRIWEEARE